MRQTPRLLSNWPGSILGEPQATFGTSIYRAAARVLAVRLFNIPEILSVCVRRSVASSEANFPFSDLDLDILISADSGRIIDRVRRRLLAARIAFPRTGQCFVLAPSDIEELAAMEPYRASINRRSGFPVRGVPPSWPEAPR